MTLLRVPTDVTWEVVVVNNRCTDSTDEVIASFDQLLPIRRAWEPTPGLSHARNRALTEATGDYVIWTDDDILVDEDWLVGYATAFRRWPDASVFGGPIEPLFEGDPPDWLLRVMDQIGPVFGRQTLGSHAIPLSAQHVGAGPYGGNMAMRRESLLRFPFSPNLGVRHGDYAIGEETEVIRRMLLAGHTGWWTPVPRVRHWVPRTSQTLKYVRRWMVGCGRSMSARSSDRGEAVHHTTAWRLYARMLKHEVGFQVRRHFAPPEVWIWDLVRAGHARGMFLASRSEQQAGRE